MQAIAQSLLRQYRQTESDALPQHVKRTAPVTDLAQRAADGWLEDASADGMNDYIAHQRREDRMRDR